MYLRNILKKYLSNMFDGHDDDDDDDDDNDDDDDDDDDDDGDDVNICTHAYT